MAMWLCKVIRVRRVIIVIKSYVAGFISSCLLVYIAWSLALHVQAHF